MLNNKLKAIGITLGAVLLVGCADIVATPTDNETNILSNLITDLEKNVNSVVFDALRDNGTINQKTLDDVLVLLAEDRFGVYSTLVESSDNDDQAFVERVERRINEKMYDVKMWGKLGKKNFEEGTYQVIDMLYSECNRLYRIY
jgi:hypothetical protein